MSLCFVLFLLLWSTSAEGLTEMSSAHHKLVSDLFDESRYDRAVRPVTDFFRPTNVTIRSNLYQIISVDEPNQNILLYVWMAQFWRDELLGWDPAEYGNIDTIYVPFEKVWLPDTYLYNNLEMQREVTERWISVILSTNTSTTPPTAQVRFQYPAIYKISCKMYVLFFPFDIQNCTLTFGSWTADSTGLDFDPESDKEGYVENEEWSLIDFSAYRHSLSFSCCPHPYTLVKMHLVIQRKPLYYFVNLLIPTVIITVVATIGFFTPSSTSGERSEKVNLGITTLLAMSILLLMISDQMPTTSNFIPLMGWFFLSIILLVSVGTLVTSILICIQLQGRKGKQIPQWAKQAICISLAKILRVGDVKAAKRESPSKETEENKANSTYLQYIKTAPIAKIDDQTLDDASRTPLLDGSRRSPPLTIVNPFSYFEKREQEQQLHKSGSKFDFRGDATCLNILQQIRNKIQVIQDKLNTKDEDEELMMEWEHLVNVLDRLFLIVFIVATIVITAIICFVGALSSQGYD